MKKILIAFSILFASAIAGLIGLSGILWVFESMNSNDPSLSTIQAWERNYKQEITNQFKEFQGHWVNGDIGAYIYSYRHTSPSIEDHQRLLIAAHSDYEIVERSESLLIFRRPLINPAPSGSVRVLHDILSFFNLVEHSGKKSEGFWESRFMFHPETNIVTVFQADLDSETELEFHQSLINCTDDFHRNRILTDQGDNLNKVRNCLIKENQGK